jgi:hypothetical protein
MIRAKFRKNIYVIQRGFLTNDSERQILAINDYLFDLDFDSEEEMRTEKPAVDLTTKRNSNKERALTMH